MAKAELAQAAGRRRRTGAAATLAVAGLVVGGLAVLPLCLLVVPGMMPTVASFCVDRRRPRYLTYAVGVMNGAGVLPFAFALLGGEASLAAAARMLASPFTWLVMYGAAAAGWGISLATPPLARLCIELRAQQQRRGLEARSRALREEWGEDVAGGKGG